MLLSSRFTPPRSIARRWATDVLERLLHHAEQITTVLETLPVPRPVHEVVQRWRLPPSIDHPTEPAAVHRLPPTPTPRPAPAAVTPSLAEQQVAHLRQRLAPPMARLREGLTPSPTDDGPDTLRQLRVASRRMRAFVHLFAPIVGPRRAKRLNRSLRTITRGIGPVRDWDLLLDGLWAHHNTSSSPAEQNGLEHVIARVQVRRAKALKALHRRLEPVDFGPLTHDLDRAIERVYGRVIRLDDQFTTTVATLVTPALERALTDLPRPQNSDDIEPLHEIRVRAKRLRYALELLKPALGDAYPTLRGHAKLLQRTIGEHRDAGLLCAHLHREQSRLTQRHLHTLARSLQPLRRQLLEVQSQTYAQAHSLLDGFDVATFTTALKTAPIQPAALFD